MFIIPDDILHGELQDAFEEVFYSWPNYDKCREDGSWCFIYGA